MSQYPFLPLLYIKLASKNVNRATAVSGSSALCKTKELVEHQL